MGLLFGLLLISTPVFGLDSTPRMVELVGGLYAASLLMGLPLCGISPRGLAPFQLGIWTSPIRVGDWPLSGLGYGQALFPHLLSPMSLTLIRFRATRCIHAYCETCETGMLSWVYGDTVSTAEHLSLPLVS